MMTNLKTDLYEMISARRDSQSRVCANMLMYIPLYGDEAIRVAKRLAAKADLCDDMIDVLLDERIKPAA